MFFDAETLASSASRVVVAPAHEAREDLAARGESSGFTALAADATKPA